MPTYNINGNIVTLTEQEAARLQASGLMNLPAPMPATSTPLVPGKPALTKSTGVVTGRTPCQIYEDAKRMGQKPAILAALKTKCEAYQQAQAFAASPAAMPMATTAEGGGGEAAPTGMSTGVKVAIGVGVVALLGGLAWYLTRD